jgi:hypothetical protein
MDKAAELYVSVAMSKGKNKATLPIVVSEISWEQAILVQKMQKHSLLVTLDKDIRDNRAKYAEDVVIFNKHHKELLVGRDVAALTDEQKTGLLFPDQSFGKATDACMLTLMKNILMQISSLGDHLNPVVAGQLQPDEEVKALEAVAVTMPVANAMMDSAVTTYSALSLTKDACNTKLPASEWETGIQYAGKAKEFYRLAQKNFYLLVSGLASRWTADAQTALDDYQGHITDDVNSPTLLEACHAFIDGWAAIGRSDEERTFTLKTAYITENKFAVGKKHLLDAAPGNNAYHEAHKKYHPMYRELIGSKNYHDVYLFDTYGNLIYSVFKELDFATNFASAGEGEWKDSGLGEAFTQAVADPKIVHVIPWKPYGPSSGALASFLSRGILYTSGQLAGVYGIQMAPESKPIDCQALLDTAIEDFDELIESLKFGKSFENREWNVVIPPPAKQAIADSIFALESEWLNMRALLKTDTSAMESVDQVPVINAKSIELMAKTELFQQVYNDEAWVGNSTVPGTKIYLGAQQKVAIQKMVLDTVLFYMAPQLETPLVKVADILAAMTYFDEMHALLKDGGTYVWVDPTAVVEPAVRRLVDAEATTEEESKQNEIRPSTDTLIVKLMADTNSAWGHLKQQLTQIVSPADGLTNGATQDALRDLASLADLSATAQEEPTLFFSGKIKSIVLEPVAILAPMPLTGAWNAGVTMRTAVLLSQGMINAEQIILPGFSLINMFFDDKCDAVESQQIVLREMASSTKYVALGGSGCDKVCSATAFVAASIRLPYLSYECAGDSLSNTDSYPDFTRFGTVTTQQVDIFKEVGARFAEWSHIAVVSGDPAKFRTQGEALSTSFTEQGFMTNYVFAYDTDWTEIVGLMDGLRMKKRRVIYVMGSESYFRKIVCASIVVKANMGISWLSEGSWREGWYAKSDAIIESQKRWT